MERKKSGRILMLKMQKKVKLKRKKKMAKERKIQMTQMRRKNHFLLLTIRVNLLSQFTV
jgi:hypothetical protein